MLERELARVAGENWQVRSPNPINTVQGDDAFVVFLGHSTFAGYIAFRI